MEVTQMMVLIVVFMTMGYFLPLCLYFFRNRRPLKLVDSIENRSFSIVIAFRNEYRNLSTLLDSLKQLDYPFSNFEVIFINDHSNDQGAELISNCLIDSGINFYILELDTEMKGKKAALSMGIQGAIYDYVITLDADCIVPTGYLKTYNAFIQSYTSLSMVGGEVAFMQDKGFLNAFQSLDLAAMVSFSSLTMQLGHPTLVNGANLCIRKKDFIESGGYSSNEHLSSGDDVFLLHDFKKQGREMHFVNDSETVVFTRPTESWKEFVQQKIRWVKKSIHYKDLFTQVISVWLILIQFFTLTLLFLLFSSKGQLMQTAACLLIAKVCSESLFLFPHLKRIGRLRLYLLVLPFQLLYPIYIIVITILAQSSTYTWKGRTYT